MEPLDLELLRAALETETTIDGEILDQMVAEIETLRKMVKAKARFENVVSGGDHTECLDKLAQADARAAAAIKEAARWKEIAKQREASGTKESPGP